MYFISSKKKLLKSSLARMFRQNLVSTMPRSCTEPACIVDTMPRSCQGMFQNHVILSRITREAKLISWQDLFLRTSNRVRNGCLKRLVEEKEQKVPTSTNKPKNYLCQVKD